MSTNLAQYKLKVIEKANKPSRITSIPSSLHFHRGKARRSKGKARRSKAKQGKTGRTQTRHKARRIEVQSTHSVWYSDAPPPQVGSLQGRHNHHDCNDRQQKKPKTRQSRHAALTKQHNTAQQNTTQRNTKNKQTNTKTKNLHTDRGRPSAGASRRPRSHQPPHHSGLPRTGNSDNKNMAESDLEGLNTVAFGPQYTFSVRSHYKKNFT